jgi:hypothetical protein
VESHKETPRVVEIAPTYLYCFFSITDEEVCPAVEVGQGTGSEGDLKGARLEGKPDGRLLVQPFNQLAVVLRHVRTHRTQIEPPRDLTGT